MHIRIDHALPEDASVVAQMVGELLRESMMLVETKTFWLSPGGDGHTGSILDHGWKV